MRTLNPLDALFPHLRQRLLSALLLQPERWWYLADLARHLHVTPSSLQREVAALVDAGILRTRRDGNRVYYQANPICPFLPELQGLFAKTVGLTDVLREALTPLWSSIEFAFIYGSVARGEHTSESDVDLMGIGPIHLSDLAPALRAAERQLGRCINPTLYTLDEFAEKLAEGHHFLTTVMQSEKLFLKGDDHELAEALSRAQGQATHHQ